MKPTPLQTVKKSFGTRADLATQLSTMVDKRNGDETEAQVKSRLLGLSNRKLLRLYRVEQRVREQYGDKSKLVDQLMDARVEAGHTADETLRTKLEGYSKARLLDLTRQKLAPRAQKLTPEQKSARKRGKKATDRT